MAATEYLINGIALDLLAFWRQLLKIKPLFGLRLFSVLTIGRPDDFVQLMGFLGRHELLLLLQLLSFGLPCRLNPHLSLLRL